MRECETSIIVPIYNVEKYLKECLRSLSTQTAENYEVILVDDGSTDGSSAIALRFAELFKHFRYVRTANLGLGAARNLGLSLAAGEYLGFVDSDDLVTEDFVASLVAPFRDDPAIDMTVCGFRSIAEDGSSIGGDDGFSYLSSRSAYLHSGRECYAWNKCFRRALIVDQRFYIGRFEDLSLIPHLLCTARKLGFVRRALYVYRQRHGSLSSSTHVDEQHLFWIFSAIDHLKQLATPADEFWAHYAAEQLPNHAFAYRVRELFSLVGRDRSLGTLTRYSEALSRALPGWSRSRSLNQWLGHRVWWKQFSLGFLAICLASRILRPLLLLAAICRHAAQQHQTELDEGALVKPPHVSSDRRHIISSYDIIECRNIAVAIDPKVVSEPVIESLREQRYEVDEERELQGLIEQGEIILEIGAGCGLLSTYCALRSEVADVFCVEANPLLIPLIVETHRINRVHVTVYNEILGSTDGTADFYLHEDFWGSSKAPRDRSKKVHVRMTSFQSRLNEIKPTLIVVDIEGGEVDLFDEVNLPHSVRKILVEVHQNTIGRQGVKKMFDILSAKNFHYDQWHSHRSIVTFSHVER